MSVRHWGFASLLFVAGVAFWLLLAGPAKLLGLDAGNTGMVLLVAVAWTAMYAVSRLPAGELGQVASPAEWQAWIGTGFMLLAIAYFAAKLHVFSNGPIGASPDAAAAGRNLVMLLIAWTILSRVLRSRWQDEVQEDERDREIAVQAARWGRGALVVTVIGLAVLLGLSPAAKLPWATHLVVANLLVMALMWGYLSEYVASALYHLRDRRQS